MKMAPSCTQAWCVLLSKRHFKMVYHIVINNHVRFGEWMKGNAMWSLNLDEVRNFKREFSVKSFISNATL